MRALAAEAHVVCLCCVLWSVSQLHESTDVIFLLALLIASLFHPTLPQGCGFDEVFAVCVR